MNNRQEKGMALITALLVLLLISTMIVGLAWLTMTDQKLGGNNSDRQLAFYGAESGMETLTARLENEFDANYAPTATDITNLQLNPPTNVPGVQYLAPGSTTNGSGFTITFNKKANGDPASNSGQLTTGQDSGLVSQNTPYTLTVTAHTSYGSEVKLQRVVQTVGIPVFEFGVFCQYDCAFFSGSDFTMGGRVAANGNLWLQELSGKTLKISGKTTAAGEIVTGSLENGGSVASYGGTVDLADNTGVYHNLLAGSLPANQSISGTTWNVTTLTAAEGVKPVTYTYNTGFSTVASNIYGANVGVKETGVKPLNLSIATAAIGGQPIDLIRRPGASEDTSNPNKLAERFYGNQQTSVRILLSDYGSDGTCAKSDISSTSTTALPGLTTLAPIDLATLAWDTTLPGAIHNAAPGWVTPANVGVTVFPLPVSGAKLTTAYTPADGYWIKTGDPIITGCIKIEYQDNQSPQVWHDITKTVLNLGYTGRNIDPQIGTPAGTNALVPTCAVADNCPASIGAAGVNEPLLSTITTNSATNATAGKTPIQVVASGPVANATETVGCQDPSPNAVIRLARLRDNPSTAATGNDWCGNNEGNTVGTWSGLASRTGNANNCAKTQNATNCSSGLHGTDYWPNVLFDTREGMLNQQPIPASTTPTLAGSMYYVELDIANLANCLNGGVSPMTACAGQFPNIENTNGYAIYFSDRRSEQQDPNPPASVGSGAVPNPAALTGGFGYDDFVNPASGYACPNGQLDTGEDVEADYTNGLSTNTATTPRTYGNILNPPLPATAPTGLWPVPGSTTTYMMVWASMALFETAPGTGPLVAYPFNACAKGVKWPFAAANQGEDVRENPPIFFRRALKLVDGSSLPMATCIDVLNVGTAVNCGGLTIASENPVYVQGDYNNNPTTDSTLGASPSVPGKDLHAAAAIIADAVTLLSDNWNDVNSFAFPYDSTKRVPVDTTYRVAIMGGKQVPFPKPTYTTPAGPQPDAGTDGGVHNFLRYLEDWGKNTTQTVYYMGSMVSMFYNHQAVGIYKYDPNNRDVYNAPTRVYSFDTDFNTPALLPPETPMLRDVNAIGFTQIILPTQ